MNLKKSISHSLEYLLLRTVQIFLRFIPRFIGLRLGAAFGLILYYSGIYRKTIKNNLEHVGYWDADEMRRIIRSLYRNIGRYAIDFLRPAYPLPPCHFHNIEQLDPILNNGKGTIAILGHLGNWEMLATVFGKRTGRLHVVAQTMSNAIVDKWLYEKRSASSVKTIYTGKALRKMFELIKNNGIIAILIDQFSRNHGTPAPFLGKTAKTVRTVAGIVKKTGCNVVSINAIMRPDGTYDINFITFSESDVSGLSGEETVIAYQKLHNDVLSEQIRAYPEHWFGWFHRRFRGYVKY